MWALEFHLFLSPLAVKNILSFIYCYLKYNKAKGKKDNLEKDKEIDTDIDDDNVCMRMIIRNIAEMKMNYINTDNSINIYKYLQNTLIYTFTR